MVKRKREKVVTDKNKAFLKEYIRNGLDGTNAYMAVYDCKSKSSAASASSLLLSQPHIQEEFRKMQIPMQKLAIKMGLTDTFALEKVEKLLNATKDFVAGGEIVSTAPDYPAIAKGVELWAKLLGKFTPDQQELTGKGGASLFGDKKFEEMTQEELEEAKKKILDNLRELNQ